MPMSASQRAAIAAAIDSAAAASQQRVSPAASPSFASSSAAPNAPRVHVNRRGSINIDFSQHEATASAPQQPESPVERYSPPPPARRKIAPRLRSSPPSSLSAEAEHAQRSAQLEGMLSRLSAEHDAIEAKVRWTESAHGVTQGHLSTARGALGEANGRGSQLREQLDAERAALAAINAKIATLTAQMEQLAIDNQAELERAVAASDTLLVAREGAESELSAARLAATRDGAHLQRVRIINTQLGERVAQSVDADVVDQLVQRLAEAQREGAQVRATASDLARAVDAAFVEKEVGAGRCEAARDAAKCAVERTTQAEAAFGVRHAECTDAAQQLRGAKGLVSEALARVQPLREQAHLTSSTLLSETGSLCTTNARVKQLQSALQNKRVERQKREAEYKALHNAMSEMANECDSLKAQLHRERTVCAEIIEGNQELAQSINKVRAFHDKFAELNAAIRARADSSAATLANARGAASRRAAALEEQKLELRDALSAARRADERLADLRNATADEKQKARGARRNFEYEKRCLELRLAEVSGPPPRPSAAIEDAPLPQPPPPRHAEPAPADSQPRVHIDRKGKITISPGRA